MEVLITIIILSLAFFFLYRSIKKKSKGCTSCDGCNHQCTSKNIDFKIEKDIKKKN